MARRSVFRFFAGPLAVLLALASPAAFTPAKAQITDSDRQAVLNGYADIAQAMYGDSLAQARRLLGAVERLVAKPSETTLAAARQAWIAAREPYQQTEVFRFGNPIVDEWEGRVNAWPLDEGLIDYVSKDSYGEQSAENRLYVANVIANPKLKINGRMVDAGKITKDLLANKLHEAEKIEANVATGYHAIEFLLWGQDLNGTGPGAGNRPASDFDVKNCTGGHCERRIQYLRAATDLLIDDLGTMAKAWGAKGKARAAVLKGKPEAGLVRIVTGMGSLSYGELAGERMKLGLMLHDPEEEHDCFSDNTHNSHFYDSEGIRNVYLGQYRDLKGPSLADLVADANPALAQDMLAALDKTRATMTILVKTAEAGEAYDQMIGDGNQAGNAKVQAVIDALVGQTRVLEKIVAALKLGKVSFEGSDSLDAPDKVQK